MFLFTPISSVDFSISVCGTLSNAFEQSMLRLNYFCPLQSSYIVCCIRSWYLHPKHPEWHPYCSAVS